MITRRLFSSARQCLTKSTSPPAVTRTVPYYTKGSWDLSENPAEQYTEKRSPAVNVPKNWRKLNLPMWKKHMFALKEKFPEGYKPIKKLSRDKIQEVRDLKRAFPELSNDDLAMRFKISPESIRHILKSQWRPTNQESRKIESRWIRRGAKINEAKNETHES